MKRQDCAFALVLVLAAGLGLCPRTLLAQTAPQEPGAPAAAEAPAAPGDAGAVPTSPSDPAAKANDSAAAQADQPAAATQPAQETPAAQAESAQPAQETSPAQAGAPTPEQTPAAAPSQAAQETPNAEPKPQTETQPAGGTLPEPEKSAGERSPAPAAESASPKVEEPAAQAEQAPPPAPIDPKNVTLKIATWGGAYGESQERAYFKPFTSLFGYHIEPVTYDGRYESLKDQAGSALWSLVDLDGQTAARACSEQLLERLDPAILEAAPNGAPVSEDFQAGAIRPCSVASVAWSAVVVYDKRAKRKPESIADFFDTRKFPGKRALPKQPKYSLELALMADGVAPADVYTTLATPEGQDRAFAKLASIKDDVLWWDKPSEVFERLLKKEAVMGLGFNGRAFMAIVSARQPFDILWDHQIYSFDYWAIPRGAPHQHAARAFIRFATSPGPLSDQTRWMPYGPARRSALQLVGKHAELDLDMKPFLPTFEANQKVALALDDVWWAANGAALYGRFSDWLSGRQPPAQKSDLTSQ